MSSRGDEGAYAPDEEKSALVRHEEELRGGIVEGLYGSVRAQKRVDVERVQATEELAVQHGDVARLPAGEGDSGEIEELPDGSISIPLFEERLVVSKEVVVRERVVIRKRTITEEHRIEADLRSERIEVEGAEVEGAASAADLADDAA
jgi:uncharacterized protein (TIGR02271 family)